MTARGHTENNVTCLLSEIKCLFFFVLIGNEGACEANTYHLVTGHVKNSAYLKHKHKALKIKIIISSTIKQETPTRG